MAYFLYFSGALLGGLVVVRGLNYRPVWVIAFCTPPHGGFFLCVCLLENSTIYEDDGQLFVRPLPTTFLSLFSPLFCIVYPSLFSRFPRLGLRVEVEEGKNDGKRIYEVVGLFVEWCLGVCAPVVLLSQRRCFHFPSPLTGRRAVILFSLSNVQRRLLRVLSFWARSRVSTKFANVFCG